MREALEVLQRAALEDVIPPTDEVDRDLGVLVVVLFEVVAVLLPVVVVGGVLAPVAVPLEVRRRRAQR